jgi:hypothetical protein
MLLTYSCFVPVDTNTGWFVGLNRFLSESHDSDSTESKKRKNNSLQLNILMITLNYLLVVAGIVSVICDESLAIEG